jgi:hypothetical protein
VCRTSQTSQYCQSEHGNEIFGSQSEMGDAIIDRPKASGDQMGRCGPGPRGPHRHADQERTDEMPSTDSAEHILALEQTLLQEKDTAHGDAGAGSLQGAAAPTPALHGPDTDADEV